MPRTTPIFTSRTVCFLLSSLALIATALLAGLCVMRADAERIRQENVIVIRDERSPRLERALEHMAESFRQWDR